MQSDNPLPVQLRPRQAAAYLGFGVSTLWELARREASFPQPVRLSARCTVFVRTELDAWASQKAAARGKAKP